MPLVLTFAEQREGKLRRASLETLGEGRRLAEALGGEVECVLVGTGEGALVAELGSYGARRVHVFDSPVLGAYATEPYARAVAQVVRSVSPAALLIPFTAVGKDLAPRVAARLEAGLATDCVALAFEQGQIIARRPMHGGRVYGTFKWTRGLAMATLRTNVFAIGLPERGRVAERVACTVDASCRASVKTVSGAGGGEVELSEAQIVVSAGRGIGAAEHLPLVQGLAEALRGALGASRAIVDAGWIDHAVQVGQTGRTVSPSLYVAVGISGAIQHVAGMSSSRCVVAIDKDPDAPIFKVADYGIVGDARAVVPVLTEAVKAHFAARE